ncbi:MAG: hypothetical protein Q4G28_00200 [Neisseria sp.]|nr:hypothetical protein [Neisseria sp.]
MLVKSVFRRPETFVKITVAPAQAGSWSEAQLQLKHKSLENQQVFDFYCIFWNQKMSRQAKLRFALGTRLRGCDGYFYKGLGFSSNIFKGAI